MQPGKDNVRHEMVGSSDFRVEASKIENRNKGASETGFSKDMNTMVCIGAARVGAVYALIEGSVGTVWRGAGCRNRRGAGRVRVRVQEVTKHTVAVRL